MWGVPRIRNTLWGVGSGLPITRLAKSILGSMLRSPCFGKLGSIADIYTNVLRAFLEKHFHPICSMGLAFRASPNATSEFQIGVANT